MDLPKVAKEDALKTAREFYHNSLAPALDELFSKIDKGKRINIERLTLELGEVSEENILENLKAAWDKAFKENAGNVHIGENSSIGSPYSQMELLHFAAFLNNGIWDWKFQSLSEAELKLSIKKVIHQLCDGENGLQFVYSLSNHAIVRLEYLALDDKQIWRSLILFFVKFHPLFEGLDNREVLNFFKLKSRKLFFFKKLLPLIVAFGASFTFHEFYELLFKNDTIAATNNTTSEGTNNLESWATLYRRKANPFFEAMANYERLKPSLHAVIEPAAHNFITLDLKQKENLTQQEEAIKIFNAGLILLHPYLIYVFKDLGWLTEKAGFRDFLCQQKAVKFLNFVAFGDSGKMEHGMYLCKILCGYPLHEPISHLPSLTRKEKAAANDLLESFIAHWEVLKNTSPKGLVKSFIQRDGLVKKTDNGFLIQVEKNSIDILLERLPFAISIIKFPWNEYIIRTEWA